MELVTYQLSCQPFCTLEWPYQNLFIDQVTWQTCPILWSTSDSKVTRFGLIINIFVSRFEVHHACKYIYIYIPAKSKIERACLKAFIRRFQFCRQWWPLNHCNGVLVLKLQGDFMFLSPKAPLICVRPMFHW